MIYEYAAEPFTIAGWVWIPLSIIGLWFAIAIVASIIQIARDYWDAADLGYALLIAAFLSFLTAVLGIALPSGEMHDDWRVDQIEAALIENGYEPSRAASEWYASKDGEIRTGTASLSDDIVTIKDLTDLEVVK